MLNGRKLVMSFAPAPVYMGKKNTRILDAALSAGFTA